MKCLSLELVVNDRWEIMERVVGEAPYLFFSKSRISVRSFSSAVGSGAGAGAAGSSVFFFDNLLIPFTRRKTQKAMMMKSNVVCKKLP